MKRNKSGFTLVELIIVIAVIGVLAAILIPVFSNVIQKANEKSARSDARNAVSQYIIDATEDRTLPNDIVIMVFKAGKCYLYGYDTESPDGLVCSVQNADPAQGTTPAEIIDNYSYNRMVEETPAPDENATYSINSDGAFYLTVHPELRSIRGASFTTIPGTGYMQIETEEHGDNTAIFDGFLLPGTYETDVQSSADAGNTNTSTSTPAATAEATETPAATQAPTAEPTPTATQEPTPTLYSVTFNANGGTGSMDGTTANGSYTLPACTFTAPAHKHFTGWKANNEGISIAVGDEYNVTTAVEFYAQWTDDASYSVTYNKNAADATGSLTDNTRYYDGDTATVLANNFSREGYTFKYFTTTSADTGTHYTAGNTITINGAGVTLYAQWQINSYTVTFYANGSQYSTAQVNHGSTATAPTAPTKTGGYTFKHWSLENNGADATTGAEYNFATVITGNTSLYAVWNAPAASDPVMIIRFCYWDESNVPSGVQIDSQLSKKTYFYDGHENDFYEVRIMSIPTADGNLVYQTSGGGRYKISDTSDEALAVTFADAHWPNIAQNNNTAYRIYRNGSFYDGPYFREGADALLSEGDTLIWYVTVKEAPISGNVVFHSVTEPAILPVPYEDR